jgi:hypothetical protein
VCRGCELGNNSKANFLSSKSRSKGILDLIHSNVCRTRSVEKDEEKEVSKGKQRSKTSSVRSQPSDGEEEVSPSIFFKTHSWFETKLRDAQEQFEAHRSIFKEMRPPKNFLNFIALMSNIIE